MGVMWLYFEISGVRFPLKHITYIIIIYICIHCNFTAVTVLYSIHRLRFYNLMSLLAFWPLHTLNAQMCGIGNHIVFPTYITLFCSATRTHYRLEEGEKWEKNENVKEEEEEEEEGNKKEKSKTNLRCLKIRHDGVLLRWQLFWALPIFSLFNKDISAVSLYFIILKKPIFCWIY
jgi:hypothetical protein